MATHCSISNCRCWEIWSARQPTTNLQALSVLSKISQNRVCKVKTMACNGVKVSWAPYNGPVVVKVSVKCLSTDFTNQKGVKGIPLFIQIGKLPSIYSFL